MYILFVNRKLLIALSSILPSVIKHWRDILGQGYVRQRDRITGLRLHILSVGKDSTFLPDTSSLWLLFWQIVFISFTFLSNPSSPPSVSPIHVFPCLKFCLSLICSWLTRPGSVSEQFSCPNRWPESPRSEGMLTAVCWYTCNSQLTRNQTNFPGVNTPTTADFKLSKGHH